MLCITGHVLLRSNASVRGWMNSSGMYVLGLFFVRRFGVCERWMILMLAAI